MKIKKLIYLTGPQGSGKSTFVKGLPNALEVEISESGTALPPKGGCETVVFTSEVSRPYFEDSIRLKADALGLEYERLHVNSILKLNN